MILLPELNAGSFVFFFEKGDSGTSWSIRDYSVSSRVSKYGPTDFRWSADDIQQMAMHSFDAPVHSTEDLDFWHEHTRECNKSLSDHSAIPSAIPDPLPIATFPVLNLQRLLAQPKSRKPKDMERILHSPNSEDWVTWTFFQVMLDEYPDEWWPHIVTAARARNADLTLPFDAGNFPAATLWPSVCPPVEYEKLNRARMLASENPVWISRAQDAKSVEGQSEIDVVLEHDRFLIYAEAKLGSDISMNTKYDPERNQIIRNIDCLIENAGNRTPVFWMLVRDDASDRAYVQLMNSYKANPALLLRDLPHRNAETLAAIAKSLTIILWSDFKALVQETGSAAEMATKREWNRRISSAP